MKKSFLPIILVLLIFLASCNGKKADAEEISIPVFDENLNIHNVLDIENETDYENMIAFTDKNVYDINTEEFVITVQNNNVGKGFYLYSIPLLQKENGNKWETVKTNTSELPEWFFIGEEGNTSESNFTKIKFLSNNIAEGISFGKYRFVIFTKEKIVYAEFFVE